METSLTPEEVLRTTQIIERELGRQKKSEAGVYTDRPIDIDILLYDGQILQTDGLTIPHPLMHERDFVMKPLAEIAPDVIHPVLQRTMKEIAAHTGNK